MTSLKINIDKVLSFVSKEEVYSFQDRVKSNLESLKNKTGKGNDFLGWVNLPSSISETSLKDIESSAANFKEGIDICIVIGIGGSYLGAKAVNDALMNNFEVLNEKRKNPLMIFAGHNIGEDYMQELLDLLEQKSYGIVVISKSGTTTEPAIAFRILKSHLENKIGKEASKKKIIAITDGAKGALRQLADNEGYKTYVIPDDVGGRYSVLTPVGLVPLAICGHDIRKLVKGAVDMEKASLSDANLNTNPAALYAATRNALYQKGKKIEILVNYNNKLHYVSEWWKQLYGESEGKEGKGIYPASVDNSSDLHSMGQYIQEGERILFETVISVVNPNHKVLIPKDDQNLDKLNFLSGKHIDEVNKMAELGTMIAHLDGGVPNIHLEISEISEYSLGQLIYFFELACGISGYLLEVNPFDQPGVEAYKKNMFALLEKPGFEEETKKIKSRL